MMISFMLTSGNHWVWHICLALQVDPYTICIGSKNLYISNKALQVRIFCRRGFCSCFNWFAPPRETSSPYACKNTSDINSASLEHQCAQVDNFHVPSVGGALLSLDDIRQLMRLRLGYLRINRGSSSSSCRGRGSCNSNNRANSSSCSSSSISGNNSLPTLLVILMHSLCISNSNLDQRHF